MNISRVCKCVASANILKFSLAVSKPLRKISNCAGMFAVAPAKKTPVVVLFGWLSCQKKHLDKYTNMYEQQGVDTIGFWELMPDSIALHNSLLWKRVAHSLADRALDRLAESDSLLEQRAIFVHLFSTSGWVVYGALLQKMEQMLKERQLECSPQSIRALLDKQQGDSPEDRRRRALLRLFTNLKGVVLDCGPVKPSFVSLIAIFATFLPRHLRLWPVRVLVALYTPFFYAFVRGSHYLRAMAQRNFGHAVPALQALESPLFFYYLRYNMLHPALSVPELYLYSGRDTIATPRKVERHINHRVQLTRAYLQSHPEAVNELLAAASRTVSAIPAAAALPNGPGNVTAEAVKDAAEARLERATRQLVRTHFFPTGAHVAILREHPHDYERRIADMLAIANALC